MHLNRYTYIATANKDHFDYEFESKGPKGVIRKVVRFTELDNDLYNLGFGDLDEKTGEISDLAATNNADTEKVLATVAIIADNFAQSHPTSIIIIRGTTRARTRLYQINVSKYEKEITKIFQVQGYVHGKWELFRTGVNYEAFAAFRR